MWPPRVTERFRPGVELGSKDGYLDESSMQPGVRKRQDQAVQKSLIHNPIFTKRFSGDLNLRWWREVVRSANWVQVYYQFEVARDQGFIHHSGVLDFYICDFYAIVASGIAEYSRTIRSYEEETNLLLKPPYSCLGS